jgi:hypothetical protein
MSEIEKCERITDVVSLCGGGIPAVLYATGILYGMYKSGKLLQTVDGVNILNPSLLITASSGGTVPLLLLNLVINNNLHNSRNDWFEHYIIKRIEMLNPLLMGQLYLSSAVKSMCVYNGVSPETIRICNDTINGLIKQLIPTEIINGNPLLFQNTPCCQMRYNYVIDSEFNESPIVSNDFTHLNNLNVVTQISEIIISCCIAVSFSHLRNGTINDAALLVDNDILNLDSYSNLKNIIYYSLVAYDEKTNNAYRERNFFSSQDFNIRSNRIYNYRAITNLKLYASSNCAKGHQIKFNLITFPNKFNPICKYNNKIYKELVPNIFYQNDFPELIKFVGLLNGDPRMLQLMFLIGAFETMSQYEIPDKQANKITDDLPVVYKQVLDDPYNVYYKTDPLSVLSRIIFMY